MPIERLIEIKGIPEVTRALSNMPKQIVVSAFAEALDAGAGVIMAELISRTPERDEGDRSEDEGHLIDGLTSDVEVDSSGKGGRVSIGFGRQGKKALWVEYGHLLVGHEPGETHIGEVPPHPFMRPAADASAEAAIEAFAGSLEEALNK